MLLKSVAMIYAIGAALLCVNAFARSVVPVAPLSQPTRGHTATLLADGQVLVVAPSGRSERFDPTTNTWSLVQSAAIGTSSHQTVRLNDGRVWLGGGMTDSGEVSARTELFSPINNAWISGVPLSVARAWFTANRLSDGRVLVLGGKTGASQVSLASSEIVSVDAGTVLSGPTLPSARSMHTATLLANGDLIVLGGLDASNQKTNTCYRLVSGASDFTSCSSMPFTRANHRATLLGNGKILVVGGASVGQTGYESQYDPASDSWSTTSIPLSSATNFAVAPRNGNSAVIWGGAVSQGTFSNPVDPKRYFWPQDVLDFLAWRDNRAISLSTIGSQTLTELADGRTLVAGGSAEFGCVANLGLGCVAYGEIPTASAYVIDRAVARITFRADDGELPVSPQVGDRYSVTGWARGDRNPNLGTAVSISDGSAQCVATAPATSCKLTTIVAGPKQYTWTFDGDSEYLPTSINAARPSSANVRIERVGKTFSYVSTTSPSGVKYCGLRIPVWYFADCDISFAAGTALTFTAAATTDDAFIGWQGACAGSAPSCNTVVPQTGSAVVRAVFAPTSALPLKLDIDGDVTVNSLSDGQLIIRFMSRIHDTGLTQGALGADAQRTSSDDIEERLNFMSPLLDVDQNGQADPNTDGIMILRFLLGFRGANLTHNVVGLGARRTDPIEIENHLQSLML